MNISLYELIKQESQKKHRPLKVVVDWDKCLFAFRPFAIFEIGKISRPFKDFFEEFWQNTIIVSGEGSSQDKVLGFSPSGKEEKLAWEKWNKINEERKNAPDKNVPKYSRWVTELHDPYLSTAEDLLRCLKESLITQLLIISATKSKPSLAAKRKEERFARSFSKFPQASLNIPYVVRVDGKNKPHRWETIRDNYPDFDIFIDDDAAWIKSVRNKFDSSKTYALVDYKFNQSTVGDNIYHVKTTISDLKDIDFALGALEYRTNKLQQGIQELKTKSKESQPSPWPWWLIFLLGIGVFLGLVLILLALRRKRKSD